MTERLSFKSYINCQIDTIIKKSSSKKSIVLLHGYRQTNNWIYKKLLDSIGSTFNIIAPNAPYLVPRRNPNLIENAYAWYFFNDKRTEYLVPIDDAIRIVSEIIKTYVPDDHELYLCGFSQGGYLTPFIGQNFKNTQKIILLSARIRTEVLREINSFETHSIHGNKDLIINIDRSRNCHKEFIELGNKSFFHEIDNLEHDINEEVQKKLSSILSN